MLTPSSSLPAAFRGLQGRPKSEPQPLRCFVYCRKSTDDDSRQIASIESQQRELETAFAADSRLHIVDRFEEAQTAKTPGRPVFAEMLRRIEAKEADCIVAWAPDRLARNSIDGGRVIYLLDQGLLRDLRFATYTFENNSQGKFMLSIMFGQSKYYSDALSDNVKRGNRTKASKGWRPNSVPMGYVHDNQTRTIGVSEFYFPMIRRIFDLGLTGGYSAREITRIADKQWGLRSPSHRKSGGKPLAHATIHRILTNPFYAGFFEVQGQAYIGQHTPMVTWEEFERIQAFIRRPTSTRANRRSFALTGLIRCGTCGRSITAEEKVNRYGSRYTYYHCSKSGLGPRCPEPSVRAEALEAQIAAWLRSIAFGELEERRLRLILGSDAMRAGRALADHSLRMTLEAVKSRTVALIGMRERDLISDDEFRASRTALQSEEIRLAQQLNGLAQPILETVIPPLLSGAEFSNYAADRFEQADKETKRQIIQVACSNPRLTNKTLSVEAAKWLCILQRLRPCLIVRGRRDEVRTFSKAETQALQESFRDIAADALAWGEVVSLHQQRLGDGPLPSPTSPKSPTSPNSAGSSADRS